MRSLIVLTVSALALAGCASTGGGKLPACDGKHRRPANPYGSVLTSKPEPQPPAVSPKPKTLSVIQPTTFASCRA
jgi:hypothetical protein